MIAPARLSPSRSLPLPAPETASGGKIRARPSAPGHSAHKPLCRLGKKHPRTKNRVGLPIFANTIGNLVAGKIAGSRGQPYLDITGENGDPIDVSGVLNQPLDLGIPSFTGAGDGTTAQPTLGVGDALPGDIVVTARRNGYDGVSAAIAQAVFVTSEAKRAGAGSPATGVSLQGMPSIITGLSLTKD
jgi:hypothetical protein